ncbi:hypothetical protein MNBD_GAMMA26-133 [hydrothermal vent metagenome]|uniref:Antitoxin n=1 Tax=hydrothermal vent metagenome TaxID=652676 RepID=A0A3B1ATW4_9ZZZZ
MNKATISHLKNHLPEIVHHAEAGQDIQITRHGQTVAVIVSLKRYNSAFSSGKGIFNTYLRWRDLHPEAGGFSAKELEEMRIREPYQSSNASWD